MVRLLVALGLLAGSWLIGALVGGSSAAADPPDGKCPVPVLRTGGICQLAGPASKEASADRLSAKARDPSTDGQAGRPEGEEAARLPDIMGVGKQVLDRTTRTALSHRTVSAVPNRQARQLQSVTDEIRAPVENTVRLVTDESHSSGVAHAAQSIGNRILPAPYPDRVQPIARKPPSAGGVRAVTAPPVGRRNDRAAPRTAPRSNSTPSPHKSSTGDGAEGLPAQTKASSCASLAPAGDGATSSQAGVGGVVALVVSTGRVAPRSPAGTPGARSRRSPRSMADLPTVFPD
ncbi:hypothetical protein [Amycolatopsis orientalis]|uniref:hypothetical protein n=1 Tax=Amycolatopsis orientalis TaxID=31958 RepID=UPI00131A1E63|nr:hypothetical protein [Amycolatopsis orientalis]